MARAAKKPKEHPADAVIRYGATPERVARAGGDVRIGADKVARVEDAPLTRLYSRQALDRRNADRNRILFEAGERYFEHWYRAGLSGIGAINYASGSRGEAGAMPPSAMPSSEMVAYHRGQVRQAQHALGVYFGRVVDMIILEQQEPATAGCRISGHVNQDRGRTVALDRLTEGLARLAQMWGMSA